MPDLQAKHPHIIRWLHWFNLPLLALMLWSGLLIYWANDVYRIGWGGGPTGLRLVCRTLKHALRESIRC